MRITLFLLFLSILCSQAATGYSQGVELSLDSRSASIKEICKEIERKSDFRFVFTGNAKRLFKKKVDIGLDSRNIEEILDAMLADTDFSYSIIENQVVIYHDHTKVTAKNAKEMIPELTVQQQKKTITGTVVDANGEPIIGANIIESGTTNGTITDANGKFSLKVEDKATIRVSYIGYIDQNINTSEKVSFDITLLEDVELLDEIVVVGYGTMKKSDLTGAIKSISMENLPPSVNTNIVQSLRGLVAGLNVSGGNRAGEVPSMTIRGQNTLSASSTPLIVLDGIIFNGNFSDINPTDVERIDILKDASSSAIYGSRSANGVVHVTTKKGKTEKPKVNFEVSYGIQDYTNNPVKWMNAEQYAHRLVDYNYFQKLYTWYKKSPKSPTDLGGKPVHPGYSDDVVMSVLKSEDERKNWKAGNEINWIKEVSRIAPSSNYNFSISGGKEKYSYFASISHVNMSGILKGDEFKRSTLNLKVEGNVTDWFKVGLNTSNSYRNYSGLEADMYAAQNSSPLASKCDENGKYPIEFNGEFLMRHPLRYELVDDLDKKKNIFVVGTAHIEFPFLSGLIYDFNYSNN